MDGFEIPIGADFTVMQQAFERIIAAVNAMGDKIVVALEKSSAAATKTSSSLGKLTQGSAAAGAAADQVGTKADGAGKKLMTIARGAIAVGGAMGNLSHGIAGVGAIMTALSSNNFGTMMSNLTRIGRGLRSALSGVWTSLKQLGTDRSLLKIAAGAAVGVAGVLLLRQAFRTVLGSIRLLKNAVTGVFSGMVSAARGAARSISGAFSGIASMPGKMMGAIPGLPLAGLLGAAGGLALLVTQVKAGAEVAGDMERLGVAFSALTGTGAGATSILASMRENWLRTGNTIAQQAPTIQKFLALGFSSSDAIKLQKNLLDIAGAVGMTSDEAAGLGTALAQVNAKGVVSMEELRQQIAEKGVPVFEALAAKLGVTQAALIKLVSDGKVPASELIDMFLNMEGSLGKFKGGADRMGGTFLGLVSRMQGAWSLFRAEFMTPVIDAIKPILEGSIARIQTLMSAAKELGEKVGNAISIVFTAFRDGKAMVLFQTGLAMTFHGAMDILYRGFRSAVAFLATALPPIFELAIAKLSDPNFWKAIGLLFESAGKTIAAEIRSAIPGTDPNITRGIKMDAEIARYNARAMFSRVDGPDASEVIAKLMTNALDAAKEAGSGPASAAFVQSTKTFQETVEKLQATVDADRAARSKPASSILPPTKAAAQSPVEAVSKAVQPAVMSLTRIGGGGFAATVMNSHLAEAKKQTGLLKKIATAVERPPGQQKAVYA